jgi:phosphate uptake regulator
VRYIKRKVIRHGPSSYIVSLPLSWIKKNNVSKGDELNVAESSNKIIISSNSDLMPGAAEVDIGSSKDITPEIIRALYKKGVDEVNLLSCLPSNFEIILNTLEQEAINYEIIETTKSTCKLKCITSLTNEFDNVLRRVFLVTISLADEGLKIIEEKNFSSLGTITILEKSNNKLTTFCRRYLNKVGAAGKEPIGPLYFIVELLEKIADEYKYLYEDFLKVDFDKINPSKKLISLYSEINNMFRLFYESFYKLEYSKIREIKKKRDFLLAELENEFQLLKSKVDFCLYHHARCLTEKIYALVDPYLVIALEEK